MPKVNLFFSSSLYSHARVLGSLRNRACKYETSLFLGDGSASREICFVLNRSVSVTTLVPSSLPLGCFLSTSQALTQACQMTITRAHLHPNSRSQPSSQSGPQSKCAPSASVSHQPSDFPQEIGNKKAIHTNVPDKDILYISFFLFNLILKKKNFPSQELALLSEKYCKDLKEHCLWGLSWSFYIIKQVSVAHEKQPQFTNKHLNEYFFGHILFPSILLSQLNFKMYICFYKTIMICNLYCEACRVKTHICLSTILLHITLFYSLNNALKYPRFMFSTLVIAAPCLSHESHSSSALSVSENLDSRLGGAAT